MDDFFSFVSKAVIIIPISVVIIALILKFNTSTESTKTIKVIPTPTIVKKTVKNDSFKFDLNGPIICDNLFIKNKKIFYKNGQTNYLLNGDCLYQWDAGKYTGDKKCGLTFYVSMAESYTGLLGVDDLANNSVIKSLAKDKNIKITDVLNSCRKGEVKDESVFVIPKKVVFETK